MEPSLQAEIDRLKAEGHVVFSVSIAGSKYIYRSINRKEFRELQDYISKKTEGKASEDQEAKMTLIKELSEEVLVERALVSPENLEDFQRLPAGVVTKLSELILEASGFGEDAEPQQL